MAANPMLSNGTCYWAAGEKTDPVFIPCGNDAFGHQTCCQAGDKCVSSRACFNDELGITYLAGCSDPDYQDENCPQKPGLEDLPWVGLVTCAGSNLWSPCSERGKPSTLRSADACTCNTKSPVVAFTDATSLTDHARLPTALGQSVIWAQGFLPTSTTSTSSPTTAATSPPANTLTALPTLTSPLYTPTLTAPAQPQVQAATGMSAGAKAGLGVGVAIAVLVVLAAVFARFFVRSRRAGRSPQAYLPPSIDNHPHPSEPKYSWSASPIATTGVSELDSGAGAGGARPWSIGAKTYERNPYPPGSVATGVQENTLSGIHPEMGHYAAHGQPQNMPVYAELQG